MTDTTVETPAQPSRVQIDPMAAATEAMALNEFYKNRNLLLANEVAGLRAQVDTLVGEIASRDAAIVSSAAIKKDSK